MNNYTITVSNSITSNIPGQQSLDATTPFTFIQFLNYSRALNKMLIDFTDYQSYLAIWNTKTAQSFTSLQDEVRAQFISFLQTITISFTTTEEQRFITNINWNNNDDLEIVMPFYVEKIKQVILYYAQKRDTFKIDLSLARNKGSIAGIKSYLKTVIEEALFGNGPNPLYNSLTKALSAVNNTLEIEIEEGYDTFNDYFDLNPYEPPSFYNATGDRAKFFSSNTNTISADLFLDINQSIINQINMEGISLSSLPGLLINVDTPNLSYLQSADFLDYTTRTTSNLTLLMQAQLIQNYIGTDFYYLSTNSNGAILSGALFTAVSPFSNLLNIHYPATLTVPVTATQYERDVGLFFKPSRQSILKLESPFSFYQNTALDPNTVYIFPDPNRYGNISGVSNTDFTSPLRFNLEGELIQKNISTNNAQGNSNVTNNDSLFVPYSSLEQNRASIIIDKFVNQGNVTSLISDIFGNMFFGFKLASPNQFNTGVQNNTIPFGLSANDSVVFTNNIGTFPLSTFPNTITTFAPTITSITPNIYSNRTNVGQFYMYNLSGNFVQPISAAFANVVAKYPQQALEINTAMKGIDVYKNTFVISTSSFKIIDALQFNGTYAQAPTVPLILSAINTNNIFTSNVWNIDNMLYAATYTLVQDASANYNERHFQLNFYQYNLDNNNWSLVNNTSAFSYNVSTKLNISNLRLNYNSKQDIFNIVVDLKDSNRNIFINDIICKFINNTVYVVKNTMYNSANDNFTVNFYEGSFVHTLCTLGYTSTSIINTLSGSFQF